MTKLKTKRKRGKGCLARLALLLVILLAVGLLAYKPVRRLVETNLYPLKYTEEVERWAAEYEMDPYLIYSIIRTESSFRPTAKSSADAIGLMQMTEETFYWLKGMIAPDEALTFEDLYTPEVSIRFGTYYISRALNRYGGDVSTAAASYHSGWGTVDRLLAAGEHTSDGVTLHTFPHSAMNHYVYKINQCYQKYLDLYQEN